MKKISILFLVLGILTGTLTAQEILTYQKPPQSIVGLLEAPQIPVIRISPDGRFMLILDPGDMAAIEEISQPEVRLAGLRINPANLAQNRLSVHSDIRVMEVSTGAENIIKGFPRDMKAANIIFSPRGDKIAFTHAGKTGVELWLADLETMEARRLSNLPINDTYGEAFTWTPNGNSILAKFVNEKREPLSPAALIPSGPIVQQSLGKSAPLPTYQDLLKSPQDEAAFDYYFSSELKLVDLNGRILDYARAGIYRSFEYSPDGQYVLISVIHRPYSYMVPINRFPFTTSVHDKQGKLVKKFYEAPLAENIPAGFDAVPKGPREFGWRADKGSVLYWVEAQDNGNPGQQATVRDVILMQDAPFNLNPVRLAECYYRFHTITWGDDKLAIVTERWWRTRAERQVFIKPSNPNFRVNLYDRYFEDAYSDPGTFVTTMNGYHRPVLLTEYNALKRIGDPDNVNIFSISDGASAEGDRPFILQFNIKTKVRDTLFRSAPPYYERPLFFSNKDFILASRESSDSVPNYFKMQLADRSAVPLSRFTNPYPGLGGIKKQKISYKRLDGITLGGTLYLPAEYKTGDAPLPVLIWAYPKEFKTAAAAAQVKGSPHQFTRLNWGSPVYWVTQGYAILDNADMPVIGESNKQPNDTFVEQIRYNAEAAIEHLVKMGVADRERIAIGGHSYGAFMAANLLAHTGLFAAGIARSGAYNRSLTPFGFQAEERTYWQAPGVYNKMSPFSYADKIKTPLLLIHGEADNNSGTYPMQSERLYSALKGHGAISRLVLLPSESHAYRAKESVLHMMWEMDQWLEKYVKNKKAED